MTKISTGQATVPIRKSRTGIISPATMKSFTGRVMKERLSRLQSTKSSIGSKRLTSQTAGNSTEPKTRPTTMAPTTAASEMVM